MKNAVRSVVLGLLLIAGMARPAAAYRRTGLFQTGDQIMDAGSVGGALGPDVGFTKLGWHYDRFAVFGLDRWPDAENPKLLG